MKGLLSWTKLVTVEPVLFFYMFVIFLESSIQDLIYVKTCLKMLDPVNASDCSFHIKETISDKTILLEATGWTRYNSLFLYFATVLSSFFVASWSDKFGRKLPMIIPPLGTIIAASINCVLSIFIHTDIPYLFISSTVSGLTFGTVGIIAATIGFIADISDESSITRRILILEAALYFGGAFGSYIAGIFLKTVDYDLQINCFSKLFICEIIVCVCIVVYIIIRIPHQMDNSEYSSISCGNLFKLNHVKDSVKTILRPRDSGKRKTILLLLLALFLIYFGTVVQFTLFYYYVKTLGWDFSKYTIFSSALFGVEGLCLILGPPLLKFCCVIPDHLIAILGITSKMAGFILFGLSSNSLMVMLCIGLFACSEYPVPAIRSMLSKIVDVDEKGRIFAFTTVLQTIAFLIGSLTLTSIFKEFSFFHGLCFEIVAVMQSIALFIIVYLYWCKKRAVTVYEIMENEDGSIEEYCTVSVTYGLIN